MDDAVRVRESAREAVADVEPERLREMLFERLADAAMTPGVLTLVAARAPAHSPVADDGVTEQLTRRAAGVQLIYEGLSLTRQLAAGDGWREAGETFVTADVEVLAADVFVARGFYLLAQTEAADCAVEVVRRFGRDQTTRESVEVDERAALDRELEADVFELAVVTGTALADADASEELKSYAAELARREDGLAGLPEAAPDRIASLTDGAVSADS